MIARPELRRTIRRALRRSQTVALIGPRQCGKTTEAREVVPPGSPNYFDLEDPADLARLDEPMTALAHLRGVVVIDEIQRRPDLFPVLRVLCDRSPLRARFLTLGSASTHLLRQSSETLAGRIETIAMGGFTLGDLGPGSVAKHWRRGSFPRSYLARSEADSRAWRRGFVRTFVERDLPQLGITIPSQNVLRFWTMLAHNHAGLWNAASLARALGQSEPTARRHLDILTGAFMVRQLPPWHANLRKRQVRSPKVYIRDTGILHELLGIGSERDLLTHPAVGASWEGYAIEQILATIEPDEAYHWSTHQGAELDLLAIVRGRKLGFEVKRQDAPTMTKSMHIALEDLGLDRLFVVYPGTRRYGLAERVEALPLVELLEGTAVGASKRLGKPSTEG